MRFIEFRNLYAVGIPIFWPYLLVLRLFVIIFFHLLYTEELRIKAEDLRLMLVIFRNGVLVVGGSASWGTFY